jgi:hypothetical protein
MDGAYGAYRSHKSFLSDTPQASKEPVGVPHLELVAPAAGPCKLEHPFPADPFMVSSPTRVRTANAVGARVGRLIDYVRQGRVYDAIGEFYAPDVELGRAAMAPMFGLETREGRAWATANPGAEWRNFRVRGVGVNGDTSFVECSLEFVSTVGERYAMHQVAVAQWCEGKIIKECLIPVR